MNHQTSNMVPLAALKRTLKHRAPLSEFFRSAGYRRAIEHLTADGYTEESLVRKSLPHPGKPAEASVHKLIAIEYLRWADYGAYVRKVIPNTTEAP